MKQVKSLIIAAFLVLALSTGAQAGDISSPGVKSTLPGDISSPRAKAIAEITAPNEMLTIEMSDSISDQVTIEILLALIALI